MGICAVRAASGLFLPGSPITDDTFFLPSCTYLLAVCSRCGEDSRTHPGIPDGNQPDSALPPLGYQRVRSGATKKIDYLCEKL